MSEPASPSTERREDNPAESTSLSSVSAQPKRPRQASGEWNGTVLCEWLVNWEPAELFLEEWGEYAYARPSFVFFGDKELLTRIREALR